MHQVTLSLLPETRQFFWTIKMLLVYMSKPFIKMVYKYFKPNISYFYFEKFYSVSPSLYDHRLYNHMVIMKRTLFRDIQLSIKLKLIK